jgi:hypothetical protein
MPQSIRNSRPEPDLVPRQRSTSQFPSPRQLAEQDWKVLVATYRLLSRLVIERRKHHLPDDADTLARQVVLVEEELEHCYPGRWSRLHPRLLLEEAGWWAEDHDDDLLSCRSCHLQNGMVPDRIDLPPLRPVWA